MNVAASLPCEIILEVFLHSLFHPRPLDHEGRLAFQTIRSVCSTWRMTSLSSPVLWSSVSTMYDGDPEIRLLALLGGWFSRAGPTTPLDLELGFECSESECKVATLAFIRRFQPRWRNLSLSGTPEQFWDSVLSSPSTNWDSLQGLTISMESFEELPPDQYTKQLDVLASINSLRRVVLFTTADDGRNKHEKPYGPVTLHELCITFDDDQVFTNFHMSLLTGYTSLTRLVFRGGNFVSSHLPIDHLTLPSLLYLSYHAIDLSLLRHLTTPALATLDIRLERWRQNEDIKVPDLSGFLARCTDALQSISLDPLFDRRVLSKILPIISERPSLIDLSVNAWPLTDEWSRGINESAWCPKLRNLTITLSHLAVGRLEEMEPLANFLKRRWEKGGRELETLTIRKRVKASQVRYDFFENVGIKKLRVTLPWD
jgi:hypothetical protein